MTTNEKTVDELCREYLEMSRASFDRMFGHTAEARRTQIGATLLARGVTQIPNIFGPITVEGETMTGRPPETYHEGRPILRDVKHGVLVLCPVGHVYTFQPSRNWAGSWLEAKANDPSWTVRCDGAMPRHEA